MIHDSLVRQLYHEFPSDQADELASQFGVDFEEDEESVFEVLERIVDGDSEEEAIEVLTKISNEYLPEKAHKEFLEFISEY